MWPGEEGLNSGRRQNFPGEFGVDDRNVFKEQTGSLARRKCSVCSCETINENVASRTSINVGTVASI